MKPLRAGLQAARADVMAKALTLTADQAAKFWPMFEKFEQEQNAVIDRQLKGIQKYAEACRKLTDANAVQVKLPSVSGLRLSGLAPSLALETRDNFFTPLRGGLLALEAPIVAAGQGLRRRGRDSGTGRRPDRSRRFADRAKA